MVILIHTSKTMRKPAQIGLEGRAPVLIDKATKLNSYLKTLTKDQIKKSMSVSDKLAEASTQQIKDWKKSSNQQRTAIDSFIGDIYSGLQVQGWTQEDYKHADSHLMILSGLYGLLKPLDTISPYRLEMGYRLPDEPYRNLYKYWGTSIADQLKDEDLLINLAAVEYSKTFTPYIAKEKIITPSFLTVSPKTKEPTFVVVHAKIARGAFAGWLIKNKISDASQLEGFNELNYKYDSSLSTPEQPVFVCQKFGGLGLSVRLT